MCLEIDDFITKRILEDFNELEPGKGLTFYKVYRFIFCEDNQELQDFIIGRNKNKPVKKWRLFSIFYPACNKKEILPGEIIYNRVRKDLSYLEDLRSEINDGIHVYTDLFTAKEEKFSQKKTDHESLLGKSTYAVVPVTCFEEDFIAAGNIDAVFMKVYLSQKDYDNAMKE